MPDASPNVKPAVILPRERAASHATLIVNTRARRGQEWFARTQACLREAGIVLDAAHPLDHPAHLPAVVREALAQGAKLILVGGGDGSLRTAAHLLTQQEAVLGVLPLGTVNDFARNLGIEPTVEAACRVIAEGRVEPIDVGRANEKTFLITASLGFSAQMQHALKPQFKKWLGPFGDAFASLLALRHLRHLRITLHSDESEETLRVMQAGVINGHYWMGGRVAIPGVDLESGGLAFYAVRPQKQLAYLHLVNDLIHGRFFETPELRAFTTRDLTITTSRPRPLVLDGDLCGYTPVRLRVLFPKPSKSAFPPIIARACSRQSLRRSFIRALIAASAPSSVGS